MIGFNISEHSLFFLIRLISIFSVSSTQLLILPALKLLAGILASFCIGNLTVATLGRCGSLHPQQVTPRWSKRHESGIENSVSDEYHFQSYPILDRRPFLLKLGLGDPSQGLYVRPQGKGLLFLQICHPDPECLAQLDAVAAVATEIAEVARKLRESTCCCFPSVKVRWRKCRRFYIWTCGHSFSPEKKTQNSPLCKLSLFLGMCSFVYDRCSLALSMGIVHWQSGDT